MRFFDLAMRYSPLYRTLKYQYEALREQHALMMSANGAGTPGQANCDREWVRKFEALDRDYRAIEKECSVLRLDAELGRRVRQLNKFARDLDIAEFELFR